MVMFIQNGNSFGGLATLGTNDVFNLGFETAGVTRATFDTTGNFAIGGTPLTTARLFVNDSGSSFAATSGAIQGAGHVSRFGDATGVVLDTGINGGNGAWLQATNQGNLAINYPIMFNPNGGNVGIGLGATTPSQLFHVAGTAGTANIRFNSLGGTSISGLALGGVNGLVYADTNGDLRKFDINGSTGLFMQNGNSFGTTATLGTNDAQNLSFETSMYYSYDTLHSRLVGIDTTLEHILMLSRSNLWWVWSTTAGILNWNDATNARSGKEKHYYCIQVLQMHQLLEAYFTHLVSNMLENRGACKHGTMVQFHITAHHIPGYFMRTQDGARGIRGQRSLWNNTGKLL
jgi:hypothetical protein